MLAVLVFGTVGFRLVEGWGLFDCFNPFADTRIEAGDVLIAMGERSKLKQMELELEG